MSALLKKIERFAAVSRASALLGALLAIAHVARARDG